MCTNIVCLVQKPHRSEGALTKASEEKPERHVVCPRVRAIISLCITQQQQKKGINCKVKSTHMHAHEIAGWRGTLVHACAHLVHACKHTVHMHTLTEPIVSLLFTVHFSSVECRYIFLLSKDLLWY